MPLRTLSLLSLLVSAAFAAPTDIEKRAPPTVTLDQGTFTGAVDGSTNKFLGIPFGKPPYVPHRPSAVSPHLISPLCALGLATSGSISPKLSTRTTARTL